MVTDKRSVKGAQLSRWTRYFGPNSKYWRVFFFTRPLLFILEAPSLAASMTEMKTHVFCQLATRGAEIQLGKTGSGRVTQTKTETDFPTWNARFQRRVTDRNIVFQIKKYVNLACFLQIANIWYFYALVVKNIHSTFKGHNFTQQFLVLKKPQIICLMFIYLFHCLSF